MKLLFVLFSVAFCTLKLDSSQFIQTSESSFDQFDGTMTVSEDTYDVECDCSELGMVEIEEAKCHPSKIKLTQDREGTGSTYEEINEKLSGYGNFSYARITHSAFRCLDGRIVDDILGTPGGDAGEFVLGLLVYQDLAGVSYTQEDIDEYFEKWLKCMDPDQFYMCTDQAAIDHVMKELAIDELDIYNPDPEIQDKLLDALVDPNNIGDTHLKLLVESPHLYSIQNDAVKYFIRSFYQTLWDTESPLYELLYLDILEGSHAETAFLEIKTNEQCLLDQVAPLVAPMESEDDTMSVLINHLDSVNIRRGQTAEFFVNKVAQNTTSKLTVKTMYSRLKHHGMLFLDVTGEHIAKDLPFYTASFV
ncbi:unnamed protein product [Blepharisma stoltei]|uniref:Uncharacterized protein n=1 Tax=Blepharisma stoltei TaxID=1481888 RepID=A0AAU9K7S8_9CILI|nr:unnamed protein product [Blepharisma stoltei]